MRNFSVCLVILFTLPCIVIAENIDSLIRKLPETSDPVKKSNLLNKICLGLVYTNPDSALYYGKQALKIGKMNTDDMIRGKSYNRIGIAYDVKNEWDSALMFYDSALVFATPAKDSITIASAYNNIGLIYWNKSMYDKAIENFFRSLNIFEILGKQMGVANTFNNIGLILMEQGRDSAALQYQLSGLRIREKIGDESGINDSRLNIALLYYNMNRLDSSARYYRKAISFYRNRDNHYALGTAYNGLAMVFDSQKKWDSSLIYYDKAIAEHLRVENNYKAASSLLNKAYIYKEEKEETKEFNTLLQGLEMVKDAGSIRVRSKILFQLARIYYHRDQYKKASDFYVEYEKIHDSLYNVDRDEKIEQIKVQYETEKKEKELLKEKAANEQLAKEKALAEIRLYNRNKWIIGISSLSLIIILLILVLYQRNQRKIQSEKDAAVIREREKGIKAVFDAQEEERQRIAKDLHDGVGQQLSAIKIHLEGLKKNLALKNQEQEKEMNSLVEMVGDTGSEIRSISHQMMPKALTELGLVAALEDMLDKSFRYHKIRYSFEHHGIKERLPKNLEVGLYRIAQELVNNIIKHSGANSVDMELMKTMSHVVLIVQDDGKGISSGKKADGIGMMNISTRLRTMNGELNMESGEDHGTTATIRIALN